MWIHPTTPVTLDLIGTKGNADLLFGWPLDTSLALFRLVIGGVLEKLPLNAETRRKIYEDNARPLLHLG
jgi:hypothetical protein